MESVKKIPSYLILTGIVTIWFFITHVIILACAKKPDKSKHVRNCALFNFIAVGFMLVAVYLARKACVPGTNAPTVDVPFNTNE